MKKLCLILGFALLLAACSQNEFSINGKLSNAEGAKIYLFKVENKQIVKLDSSRVQKDGSFVLEGSSKKPEFAYVGFPKTQNYLQVIVKNTDHLTIQGDASHLLGQTTISRSSEAKSIKELTTDFINTQRQVDSIQNIVKNLTEEEIAEAKEVHDKKVQEILTEFEKRRMSFIEKNISSLACYVALEGLNPNDFMEYYLMVDSSLTILYPNTEEAKTLRHFLMDKGQIDSKGL